MARALEFAPDGRNWSAVKGAAEIHGAGQWTNAQRPLQIIPGAVQLGEGVWEVATSSGWKPLTSNMEVLEKIEADYCAGRAQLSYAWAYRLECGCLAKERKCRHAGETDHGPERNRSHMYYVDFAQTVVGPGGEQCFRQVDLWYTLDMRRQRPVRRHVPAATTNGTNTAAASTTTTATATDAAATAATATAPATTTATADKHASVGRCRLTE